MQSRGCTPFCSFIALGLILVVCPGTVSLQHWEKNVFYLD